VIKYLCIFGKVKKVMEAIGNEGLVLEKKEVHRGDPTQIFVK
jgi:hypothetical protein